MAKLAPHAQILVPHVQAAVCVKLVSQDMVYKAINVTPAQLEPSFPAKIVNLVPAHALAAPVAQPVRLVNLDTDYKITSVLHAL